MEDLIWLPSPVGGNYMISNTGLVKSLNYKNTGREYILKQQSDKDGYLQVGLSIEGIEKTYKVHRLVAMTFIDNPNNLPQVNHIDENHSNNNVDNLEWCTHLYNQHYGTKNKRSGEKHRKKIMCIETNEIFDSITEASKMFNISVGLISKCLSPKCRNKTAKGYSFRRID